MGIIIKLEFKEILISELIWMADKFMRVLKDMLRRELSLVDFP
jgi:hypothetical protein